MQEPAAQVGGQFSALSLLEGVEEGDMLLSPDILLQLQQLMLQGGEGRPTGSSGLAFPGITSQRSPA